MDDLLNSLWIEKYRPRELSDVVLKQEDKDFFQKCINNKEIPNLLFVGSPGSGKTTIARILCDKIIESDMDILILNGSDQTGIGIVRDEIINFLSSPPFGSKHKIVFIDEFDYMSANAHASLRHIFEKYYENGRFICTGNYKSKIEPALISRFQVFEMNRLSNEYILSYCKNILEKEDVKYKDEDLQILIESLSPDVRKIVNIMQQNTKDGELKNLDKDKILGMEQKIVALIIKICDDLRENNYQLPNIDQRINDIQKIINDNSDKELDYINIYEQLFNSKIPLWAKIEVNKYCNEHNNCAIPSIHFISMLWNIVKNGIMFSEAFNK